MFHDDRMKVCDKVTLLILAAGMGSRYGGLKQLDPIHSSGSFIIDYSIYDAIKAGFDHVVFLIREEHLELFRETVGKRIEPHVRVTYAFQKMDDVPAFVTIPADRQKPWGTAHAVYCCREVIDDAFAVINSDDFYGRDTFKKLAEFLSADKDDKPPHPFCMVGFRLKNTLTENGSVSRGICETTADGYLTKAVERTKIQENDGIIQYFEDGVWHDLDRESIASMNCWGFTPAFLSALEEQVEAFFAANASKLEKAEYYLPFAVQELIERKEAEVTVLSTDAKWHGVTYLDDKPAVMSAIADMIEKGEYPENLWSEGEG